MLPSVLRIPGLPGGTITDEDEALLVNSARLLALEDEKILLAEEKMILLLAIDELETLDADDSLLLLLGTALPALPPLHA